MARGNSKLCFRSFFALLRLLLESQDMLREQATLRLVLRIKLYSRRDILTPESLRAMINIGGGAQALYTDSRDCGRIIWDDRDVVERIWSRVKGSVPEIEHLKGKARVTGNAAVMRGETWKMTRLNERMRFLKYSEGQYFRRKYYLYPSMVHALTPSAHNDGSYVTPDGKEMSFYTLHLYLNESTPANQLDGGATTFHSYDMQRSLDVDPKVGRVLIFQHRDLLRSGADVTGGIKLTLRTDLMYGKTEK